MNDRATLKSQKKIYQSIQTIKDFRVKALQKELNLIEDSLTKVEQELNEREGKIQALSDELQACMAQDATINLQHLQSSQHYISRLHDEAIRQKLLKKSIQRRADDKKKQVQKQYSQVKLYEKLADNRASDIAKVDEKIQQQLLEELFVCKEPY